ncbi:MAG: RNA methyltransferase [Bacteroidota bacterium]|nr:RNA methyltransferase [Bacteroidota bacterium]
MKDKQSITSTENKALLDFFLSFVSERRKKNFEEKIQSRTKHITLVLENIYQPHNASAVLRTCDCFGIQDVHIIENRNRYQVNPDVALGSSKWLTLSKYNSGAGSTKECLMRLKEEGYRLIATTPHQNDYTPDTLPLEEKTALIFGTELSGLTDDALSLSEKYIRIPMVGFTESLNISVSAAILLYRLSSRLRESDIPWQLTGDEKIAVMLDWARNSVKKSDLLEKTFLEKMAPEGKK